MAKETLEALGKRVHKSGEELRRADAKRDAAVSAFYDAEAGHSEDAAEFIARVDEWVQSVLDTTDITLEWH